MSTQTGKMTEDKDRQKGITGGGQAQRLGETTGAVTEGEDNYVCE